MSTAKELLKQVNEGKKRVISERRQKIIAAVRDNAIIWNKCLKEHKDNVAVDVAWDAVSVITGVSKPLAKKEWKYVRDQFRTTLSLVKVKKSGSGYDPEKDFDKIKWPYFKEMLFLKDIVSKRDTSCSVEELTECQAETLEESNDAEAFRILTSIAEGNTTDDTDKEERIGDKEISVDTGLPSTTGISNSDSSRPSSAAASLGPSSSCSIPNVSTNCQTKRRVKKRCAEPNDDIIEEMDKIDKIMLKVSENVGKPVVEDPADRFGKYIADIFQRVKPKKQAKFELKLIQTAFSFLTDSDSE